MIKAIIIDDDMHCRKKLGTLLNSIGEEQDMFAAKAAMLL
jgi:FixJ family two-component response regulator